MIDDPLTLDDFNRPNRVADADPANPASAPLQLTPVPAVPPTTRAIPSMDQLLDDALAVNLDEVVEPDPVRVAFREWRIETSLDENGQSVQRKSYTVRHPVIMTAVPMDVFNRFMAQQEAMMKLTDSLARIKWMSQQVLLVWRESEPDMTIERLERGLDFTQINSLFWRFFGPHLRRLGGKA